MLECVHKAGLTLNLKKCEFGKMQVEYLRYVVMEDELAIGQKKL